MISNRVVLGSAAATIGLAIAIGSVATAAGNPVEERQAAMKQMGAVMKESGGFVSGATAFDAAKVKTLMASLSTGSNKLHKLFPADSATAPKSEAEAKVWENKADFDKRLNELAKLADAGAKATSAETFKPSFMAIGGACKSCHDIYRKKKS